MLKQVFLLLGLLLIISCKNEITSPKPGTWRATLDLGEGRELPFNINYKENNTLSILNAEEKIEVTEVTLKGDSIIIQMPVFEGVLKGVFSETTIEGEFIKASLNRVVPFKMEFGEADRFKTTKASSATVSGNWETAFSPDSPDDRYIAKGIFKQKESIVSGTFRTTTGDYRYLGGVMEGDSMKLSTFDGAHAFLFEAKVSDSLMTGIFYSGNHFQEPFTATLNNEFELPEADSLTFLKKGFEKFDFKFPDTKGNLVSLGDQRFKDKVVLIQIMGTWCPNCLDETKYYSEYYEKLNNDDLEIVALAFEYAPTEERAIKSIDRLVNGVGVPYPVLLAQYGTSSKTKANEKLPMLNHVLSYPTTIFVDKSGDVRRIHTGFNGPATGKKYDDFVEDFEAFLQDLLAE